MDELDARLHRIGQHPFRARFRPRGRNRAVVDVRGIASVHRQTEELIHRGPAPAEPRNDGRQTPSRGHPVFAAPHATATCCRACLGRGHDIPAGHALDGAGRSSVVEATRRWIASQDAPPPRAAVTRSRRRRRTRPGWRGNVPIRHRAGRVPR